MGNEEMEKLGNGEMRNIDQSSHSRSSFTGGILRQVIRYTF